MGWNPKLRHRDLKGLRLLRVTGFEKLLILYRPLESGVEILRLVHGSRAQQAEKRGRYFGGLELKEITVKRDLTLGEAWLRRALTQS